MLDWLILWNKSYSGWLLQNPKYLLTFLPKLMAYKCEKLPLGLAPPTISILSFPSSPDGINVQVWPTLTPGALPLGIKEYLLTAKQFQQDKNLILTLQVQLIDLNLLTIFLLWVYLEGQVLGETPYLSTKLCMNGTGITIFHLISSGINVFHNTLHNKTSDARLAMVKIIDFIELWFHFTISFTFYFIYFILLFR